MEIVYAELVFDEGSKNSCHAAYCVFEDPHNERKRQSSFSGDSSMDDNSRASSVRRFSIASTTSDMSIQTFVETEDDLDMEESIKVLNEKWKEEGDEACDISVCSGMTAVGDGKVVIATKSGEIALYSATGKFLSLMDISECFEGLTTVSKDEVAVSCGYCIRFYRVEKSKLHEESQKCIDFKFPDVIKVHDIHYIDNSFVVLCKMQSQVAIKKIDMKGNTLKLFYHAAASVERYCCYPSGENLIMIEKDHRKIIAMKEDGTLSWELTVDYTPVYVTRAGKDKVVVSLQGRPDLKCLTFDGRVLSPVDTGLDPSQTPLLLCYCVESGLLHFCPKNIKKSKSSKKHPFSKILSNTKLE